MGKIKGIFGPGLMHTHTHIPYTYTHAHTHACMQVRNSCKTLIGDAWSNAPQLRSCILLAHDSLSSLVYPMITHTSLVAGNLPIKTLVARQQPTTFYESEADSHLFSNVQVCIACHAPIAQTTLHV